MRNWRFVIPFPCAPCDARLTYRVYIEDGRGCSESNTLRVRACGTGSTSARSPDVLGGDRLRRATRLRGLADQPNTGPSWPSFTTRRDLERGDPARVARRTQAGKAPVLAMIVGVLVGVAGGEVPGSSTAASIRGRCSCSRPAATPQPWDLQLSTPRCTTATRIPVPSLRVAVTRNGGGASAGGVRRRTLGKGGRVEAHHGRVTTSIAPPSRRLGGPLPLRPRTRSGALPAHRRVVGRAPRSSSPRSTTPSRSPARCSWTSCRSPGATAGIRSTG